VKTAHDVESCVERAVLAASTSSKILVEKTQQKPALQWASRILDAFDVTSDRKSSNNFREANLHDDRSPQQRRRVAETAMDTQFRPAN